MGAIKMEAQEPKRLAVIGIITLAIALLAAYASNAKASSESDSGQGAPSATRTLSVDSKAQSAPEDSNFRRRSAYDYYAKLDDSLLARALPPSLFAAEPKSGSKETSEPKGPGGESLAQQATDPTSPLIQFRMQNSFMPASFDSSGYANTAEIQPVLPWKAPWGQLMITRPTIPVSLIADPDGPVNETSGLADIDLLHLFIFKKKWGATGLGFNMSFPTATDDRLGSGKWQAGPAAVIVYTKIPKLQIGGLVYNNWSFETNRHGRDNVNKMYIQWLLNYHFKPGWYVGWGDLPMSFNWKNGKQNMPLSVKLGHTTKIYKQPVDMFVQPFYTTAHEGASGQYGCKINFALLLP
jgi:hypothetical protein